LEEVNFEKKEETMKILEDAGSEMVTAVESFQMLEDKDSKTV